MSRYTIKKVRTTEGDVVYEIAFNGESVVIREFTPELVASALNALDERFF